MTYVSLVLYKTVVIAIFAIGAGLFLAGAVAAARERAWRLFWLKLAGAAAQTALFVWTAGL